jgi:hypothetical protein
VPRLDLPSHRPREAPDVRFNCDESQLGSVELREPLSPAGRPIAERLTDDVALEWANFDVTRSEVMMALTKGGDRQVTPDPELLLLVSRWRVRAQEILAQAEIMRDAEAQQTMREIAARYERLALRVEQRTGRA